MRSEGEVRERLREIESDERLGYAPANVAVNAPLALIQVALKAEQVVLRWILEEKNERVRRPSTGG